MLAEGAPEGPRRVLASWLSQRKEKTIVAYERGLRSFAAYLGMPPAEAVQLLLQDHGRANELALRYVDAMEAGAVRGPTINQRISALVSVVKAARLIGLVNWRLEVRRPKVNAYKETFGPDDDTVFRIFSFYDTALATADGIRRARLIRDRAIILLMLCSGLRRSEVCSLDVEHVDRRRQAIHVLGKARDERERQAVDDWTMAELEAWLDVRPSAQSPALFVCFEQAMPPTRLTTDGIYSVFVALRRNAGIVGRLNPHGLRHRFITEVAAVTKDPFTVAAGARHRDIKTSMRYIDNLRDRGAEAVRVAAGSLRSRYRDWQALRAMPPAGDPSDAQADTPSLSTPRQVR